MAQLCISSIASNQGKTVLTTALLWHYKNSVRPYKVGPDFIDPQFHKYISGTDSINLDSFIMDQKQVKWIYNRYNDKPNAIIEGVMGFYDGEDRGCSTYSVAKMLDIPVVLVLDGSGSYITLSAVLEGLLKYKKDNTIQAVIFNKISSVTHYRLIKSQIEKDHPNITIAGWIPKNLDTLDGVHLGLDLNNLSKIDQIATDVLQHIEIDKLEYLAVPKSVATQKYPFDPAPRYHAVLGVVNDENFSFLYYDNLEFFREVFDDVVVIKATEDEPIPSNVDILYIPGGYVETDISYNRIKNATNFRDSLIEFAAVKPIYAECAGLLYLGKSVDNKQMSGVLPLHFYTQSRFVRLGYYRSESGVRGHAFHYTAPDEQSLSLGFDKLSKMEQDNGAPGSWLQGKTYGTYLHTMFRTYPQIIKKLFIYKGESK